MKALVPDELLLTVKETARVLRVSERTIWKMISDGRLRCLRPKGLDIVRIPRRALVAVLGKGVLDEPTPDRVSDDTSASSSVGAKSSRAPRAGGCTPALGRSEGTESGESP